MRVKQFVCILTQDDDEWVDVIHSSEKEDSDDDESAAVEDETVTQVVETAAPSVAPKRKKTALTKQQKKAQKLEKKIKQKVEQNEELTAERKAQASVISSERLFTDKDFRKIDVALAKQEVTYVKRGIKRTHDQAQTENPSGELVRLSDIENIYKKRKHDKDARQKSVKVCI